VRKRKNLKKTKEFKRKVKKNGGDFIYCLKKLGLGIINKK